ncbi:unnamed protein product [Chilo suppressalis]|uniref:Neurotransmitter-gated ion-channel ligand-binding domain-containing protein n=1 Tax=Chilo suppressalis TaxID=168631 RepID=A0ABN8BGH1_CHISP|nr:unnamed protein product [Chilo suppressalis]
MLICSILSVFIVYHSFLGIHGACPAKRHEADQFEAQLHTDLFCAYSSTGRPVQDHKNTINVEVRFAITYISFDTIEEVFTVHSKIAMTWRDELLFWDPINYGGIKEIQVDGLNIWTPRMALYNSDTSRSQFAGIFTTCSLLYNGTVTCSPHETHSGLCRTWLRNWPYDKQKCTFFFGSWIYTGEQVNFTFSAKGAVVYENFDDGPGWKLLDITHTRLPGNYGQNETYPSLKYVFELQREAKGLEAIIVVPCLVLLIITTVTLLLDVKGDTRVALQCFTLYGHFIFLNEIMVNIPKQNLETPIILLLIRDSTIMCFSSIVLTLLLTPLRECTDEPPLWLLKLLQVLTSGPGKYIVFTEFDSSDINEKNALAEQDPNEDQTSNVSVWMTFDKIIIFTKFESSDNTKNTDDANVDEKLLSALERIKLADGHIRDNGGNGKLIPKDEDDEERLIGTN